MTQQFSTIAAGGILSVLLASCAIPPPPAGPLSIPVPRESTGAKVDAADDAIGNDTAPAPTAVPETKAPERLLPTGLLEIGVSAAPLTVMMFTEHHCGYCKDFDTNAFPSLRQEFIDTGKVKLRIGILPLKKYLDSDLSAMGLLCAAQQGKGVAMHSLLFTLAARDADAQAKAAGKIGIDPKKFASCLKNDSTKAMLESEKSLAHTLDVTLVPTLFIGGEKSVGLPYYEDLRGAIEKAMNDR